jgi:hypothetical protein
MRNIFFGIGIALVLVFGLRYCEHQKDKREQIQVNSALIQKQLNNVSKLIVTEGTYAQVFTYEDSKKFYFDVFSANKKALIVVNATATISYDLSLIESEISEETETVRITYIPEPELAINPNIEYYDISQDYLNQFEAEDYNKIKNRIDSELREKIEASALVTNAQNRLISELQKIYVLTNSMGWELQYKSTSITNEEALQTLKL